MLSFLTGSVLLIAAGVFLFFHKRTKNHGKLNRMSHGWIIPFVLLFMAMCMFAASGPGQMFGRLTTSFVGVFLVSVVVSALVVGAVIDLWDGKPDSTAKIAVIVVPFLAVYGQGPIAQSMAAVVHGTQQAGQSVVGKMIGE